MNRKDVAVVFGAVVYLGLIFAFIYWAVSSIKQDYLDACLVTDHSANEYEFYFLDRP